MCVYLRDGKPIGHYGSPKSDFPAEFEDDEKQPPVGKNNGVEEVSNQFISAMMGYLDHVPLSRAGHPFSGRPCREGGGSEGRWFSAAVARKSPEGFLQLPSAMECAASR
jgi:hypothetical protein